MTRYVALLRGVNVGGRQVKMNALKKAFEALGFEDIKTLLASGNVVFQADKTDEAALVSQIEAKLLEVFGFEIAVMIRPAKYLQELIVSSPFKSSSEPDAKRYVSFLAPKTKSSLTIPYDSPDKLFKIISATKDELFSVISAGGKTTDVMDIIEKKFGKKVTTRNWNTVKKLAMLQ